MFSLGIDVGTSGVRALLMDGHKTPISQAQIDFKNIELNIKNQTIAPYSKKPHEWLSALHLVLLQVKETLQKKALDLSSISHLALDGTSGSVLLSDTKGTILTDVLMYNDQRAVEQAKYIGNYAPTNTAAIGASSGLAKILWLAEHHKEQISDKTCFLNQADWLTGYFSGKFAISDHNNALKMGYDAQKHCWPQWLLELLERYHLKPSILPEVLAPGTVIGNILPEFCQKYGFHPNLKICAGTTDSTAAIMATGADHIGQAVTSLGSTLVMKILSKQPIFDPYYGVYSQPYGDLWLVGGSSNSGGAILQSLFQTHELMAMTDELDHKRVMGQFTLQDLHYYPLLTQGERFPINDPHKIPIISPKPSKQCDFFQALLEGMADIEAMAYKKLVDLGAPYPKLIRSIGGGAKNKTWQFIREQKMGIPIIIAEQQQAATGSAILAQKFWK